MFILGLTLNVFFFFLIVVFIPLPPEFRGQLHNSKLSFLIWSRKTDPLVSPLIPFMINVKQCQTEKSNEPGICHLLPIRGQI